ncbi:alpha N-terminal protein methyltransferase 1 [Aristolochia californica]|uniref:alpha N-terminal protein methyltransferase 1 n=1 Tax=Aristolochia californica TaxID=171875 RepID=UPI0035E13E37
MEVSGSDSDGREFRTVEELWKEEIGDENEAEKRKGWYRKGVGYWEGIEASVDGVLGGYGHVNDVDVRGSEAFLKTLLCERLGSRCSNLVALDCGSGIGRVTKNLLLRHFNEVDLVEPVSHFLEAARKNLAPENYLSSDMHKPANFYCIPLQDFTPEAGRYDVIWIQWCIGHLTDDDFIAFFKRAKAGLKSHGFLVLKENIARNGFVYDKEDSSITRSDSYFKELFSQCGLHIYKMKEQQGFPEEMFAVKMYALVNDVTRRPRGNKNRISKNKPAIIK